MRRPCATGMKPTKPRPMTEETRCPDGHEVLAYWELVGLTLREHERQEIMRLEGRGEGRIERSPAAPADASGGDV